MQSRAHLQRINRAADSAIETPSGTHRDFFRRRKDRQRPFRESSRAAYSTESPCSRLLPRGCFLADLQPQSSANKEQRPTIWESKNYRKSSFYPRITRIDANPYREDFSARAPKLKTGLAAGREARVLPNPRRGTYPPN